MTARAQMAAPSPFPATARPLTLFVPRGEFSRIGVGSILIALLLAPAYWDETLWLGAGIALTVFVVWHGMLATKSVPWMPGFVIGVACVQWILAPWAAYHLPAVPTAVLQILQPSEYFRYAVPATYALAIGLFIPLRRLSHRAPPRQVGNIDRRRLLRTFDAMLVVGLFARIALAPLASSGLRFVIALVAELAWVGGFAAMLIDAPGWRRRITILLLIEGVFGSVQGIFYELVVWSIYLTLLYLFARRVRRSRIILISAVAVVGVFALNGIKASFREEIYGSNLSSLERGALAVGYLGGMLREPSRVFSPDNIAFNVQRLNQGSIIGRVMYWTPSREPFAEGETIIAAVVASLLPRALAPDKYVAGGFANYPRFTGLTLVGSTSINLSFAGEMYANFGLGGGILGMLVVGIALGGLFAVFLRWSRRSLLWWAWLPYVMLTAVSAEGGIGETLNQIVKSVVVMVGVILAVPAWEGLRPYAQSARKRAGALVARGR